MNLSAIQVLNNLAKELSMAEKGITSAKVILTGFVVVFSVLVLLIVIIKIYSSIVSGAQNKGKKKDKTDKAQTKPQTQAPAQVSAPVQQTDGVSDEVVAVISAAVASMYGSPEKARIRSIKKSAGGRSAWANAGVLDNTRPF